MSFRLSSHRTNKWMLQQDLWHTDRNPRVVRSDQISGPSPPASCHRAKLQRVEERNSGDPHTTNNTGGTALWVPLFFHQRAEQGAELLNLKSTGKRTRADGRNSFHPDWDPGSRVPLVLTSPVGSKHGHQAPNANFCLLKDSFSSCYSCLGSWIFFIKENTKPRAFTMDRISRSLLHDNEGMPSCLRPETWPRQRRCCFGSSSLQGAGACGSFLQSTLLPCTQKGHTQDVRRHIHA